MREDLDPTEYAAFREEAKELKTSYVARKAQEEKERLEKEKEREERALFQSQVESLRKRSGKVDNELPK